MSGGLDSDDNDSLTLANELRPIVLRLARHLRSEINANGLTAGQIAILVAIEFNPDMTAQRLAKREGLSEASVSGHLARLEGRGLIRRERTEDGRKVSILLTDAGRGAVEIVRQQRTSWLSARISGLTSEERALVKESLTALNSISTGDR